MASSDFTQCFNATNVIIKITDRCFSSAVRLGGVCASSLIEGHAPLVLKTKQNVPVRTFCCEVKGDVAAFPPKKFCFHGNKVQPSERSTFPPVHHGTTAGGFPVCPGTSSSSSSFFLNQLLLPMFRALNPFIFGESAQRVKVRLAPRWLGSAQMVSSKRRAEHLSCDWLRACSFFIPIKHKSPPSHLSRW